MARRVAWWVLACLAACAGVAREPWPARGTLLLIGGGLDDDNAPVYRRFLELAAVAGAPRIVSGSYSNAAVHMPGTIS